MKIGFVTCCCQWYAYFSSLGEGLPTTALDALRMLAKNICRQQGKALRQQRGFVTMETRIRDRRMPPGGLRQLQDAVIAALPWAEAVVLGGMDRDLYSRFLGLMYSAIYCFSAQGRVSGIEAMTMKDAESLMGPDGWSTSTKFKTRAVYQLQPVIMNSIARRLLELYLTLVRCRVTRENDMDSILWRTFDGVPETRMGRLVTAFFQRILSLRITTTAIRSLLETTVDAMHVNGQITQAQRTAVSTINGHSSEVVENYYVLRDRGLEVQRSREVFAAMQPPTVSPCVPLDEDPNPLGLLVLPVVMPPHSSPVSRPIVECSASLHSYQTPPPTAAAVATAADADIVWGSKRSDFSTRMTVKAAPWSAIEIAYVGWWCEEYSRTKPHCNLQAAKCLQHLYETPALQPHFHQRHTQDSARLRAGMRSWSTRKGNGDIRDAITWLSDQNLITSH
ncbi:hypothetical protein B484DRAFT_439135 [Ochromonadaceae sp. CCMP2298]|nr:hypothetical protein B484DRAFT_439135 [Ochromonadaceae sp. CCMP2298]